MRTPLEVYVVIDKDGDLSSIRAFPNKQEAESCATAYDDNYPSIAPHEVVRLMEVTKEKCKAIDCIGGWMDGHVNVRCERCKGTGYETPTR